MRRRRFIALGGALAVAPWRALAQSPTVTTRFQPSQDIRPLVEKLTGGAKPAEGGIDIELPQIAENGNSVPMRVVVKSPMTAEDHVVAVHIIAERNPRPLVASFHFGPLTPRAEFSTRVRLAGTQTVTVLAESNGKRFRRVTQDVLVTSAACLDESM